jgi:hypothetical protein
MIAPLVGCGLAVEHRRDRRFERRSAAGAREPVDDGLQAAIFGAPSASAESVLVLVLARYFPRYPIRQEQIRSRRSDR